MAFDTPEATSETDARWWEKKLSSAVRHERLWGVYEVLRSQDRVRRNAYHRFMKLYGGIGRRGGAAEAYVQPVQSELLTFNVVANMCDMAANRIGKGQPMPVVKPRGGSYRLHTKAHLLTRFFEAQFRVSDVYPALRQQFLDAAIFGTGVVHVFRDSEQIHVERILPHQLLVDHREATLAGPRQMMREIWMSKDVARAKFVTDSLSKDEKARVLRAINEAETPDDGSLADAIFRPTAFDGRATQDMILVVEAWRLPSGPGQGDGFHAFATSRGCVSEEPYAHSDFPFCFLRWKEHPYRWFGIGLAEALTGIQVEMNLMLKKIQQAYRLIAKPFILMDLASQIPKGALDNDIGTIVRYSGNKPEIWTPNGFHPEFYAHFERLYRRAYEIAGFTQDMPTAEGTRSAVQVSKKHAIETERFSYVAMRYEENTREIARRMIILAKELGPDFGVPAPSDRSTVEHIRWKDVDMEEDEYVLGIQSISAFSTLFSERLQEVSLLFQQGVITRSQYMRLAQIPDLDRETRLETSPERNIDRIIDQILSDGVYEAPEIYMQLDLGIQRMQLARNWAAGLADIDQDKLDAMDDWMAEAARVLERAATEQAKKAAEAAAGMEPGALPPGAGAPLPIGNGGAAPVEQAAPQEGPPIA